MIEVRSYAAKSPTTALEPYAFERREVGPKDVLVDIQYCGVCHSDLHTARNEWGGTQYPVVPGHEIVGTVAKVGRDVTRFKVGDAAGVGCFVDSCRTCPNCRDGMEQYCDGNISFTYNATEQDGKTRTYGGYSTRIVVDENFVLRVPTNLPLAAVAPLLCAGITTYSPLSHWKVGKLHRVGVVGLGGLGHMGVKFAVAFGAEVTVFSTSRSKEADAKKLGAHHFVATKEKGALDKLGNSFDYILDTVSASHDINALLNLLKRDGTMTLVGVPPDAVPVEAFSVIGKRRQLAGSLIGGIKETQEMLNFCGQKNIVSEIEMIRMQDIDTAYERMLKGDVRYRFVIDTNSLK